MSNTGYISKTVIGLSGTPVQIDVDLTAVFEPYRTGTTATTGYKLSSGADIGTVFQALPTIGASGQITSCGYRSLNGIDLANYFYTLGKYNIAPSATGAPSFATKSFNGTTYYLYTFTSNGTFSTGTTNIASMRIFVVAAGNVASYPEKGSSGGSVVDVNPSDFSQNSTYNVVVGAGKTQTITINGTAGLGASSSIGTYVASNTAIGQTKRNLNGTITTYVSGNDITNNEGTTVGGGGSGAGGNGGNAIQVNGNTFRAGNGGPGVAPSFSNANIFTIPKVSGGAAGYSPTDPFYSKIYNYQQASATDGGASAASNYNATTYGGGGQNTSFQGIVYVYGILQ